MLLLLLILDLLFIILVGSLSQLSDYCHIVCCFINCMVLCTSHLPSSNSECPPLLILFVTLLRLKSPQSSSTSTNIYFFSGSQLIDCSMVFRANMMIVLSANTTDKYHAYKIAHQSSHLKKFLHPQSYFVLYYTRFSM